MSERKGKSVAGLVTLTAKKRRESYGEIPVKPLGNLKQNWNGTYSRCVSGYYSALSLHHPSLQLISYKITTDSINPMVLAGTSNSVFLISFSK